MGTSPAAVRARLRVRYPAWWIRQIPCPVPEVCALSGRPCDHGLRATRAGKSLSAPSAEQLASMLFDIEDRRAHNGGVRRAG
jgi:hypothetical protein